MSERKGKIQTVLGLINPDDAGVTYTHEHLSLAFDFNLQTPEDEQSRRLHDAPISMENLGWIQRYPYSCRTNLDFYEEHEAVLEEVKQFKANGGRTIVDNTTIGLNRDVHYIKRVSEESGVNVVLGTGFYVGATHTESMKKRSVESLTELMIDEITKGIGDTGVKCGVIGEIGCSWPLMESEKTVLRATANAQASLKCPVIVHPGRDYAALGEIMRVYQESGGDSGKFVMSHLDRTVGNADELLEFAKLGAYCEFDLFGIETSLYQFGPAIMASDLGRIELIKLLITEGYQDRICIAHDMHTKHRLTKYGGHGYSHILLNVVPWMRKRGMTQDAIDKILIHNPREWLTFNA